MSESELQRRHEYFEKSSMNYWYPKVKDLDVNQSKTEKIELEQNDDEEDWIRATGF